MKTLGIIGGIAPESTIDYYRGLVAAYREKHTGYPPIIINSINMTFMLGLVEAKQYAELTEYLSRELQKLVRAGADCALLASNTPHVVFDDLRRLSSIPLLSIVETARDAAQTLGLTRLALFGTRYTMQGRAYPEVFARANMTIVAPAPEEQDYIHEKYMGELVKAIFLAETRARLLEIVFKMKQRDQIEGLILGGTELPLLLRQPTAEGLPVLDTTKIHVKRAADELWP